MVPMKSEDGLTLIKFSKLAVFFVFLTFSALQAKAETPGLLRETTPAEFSSKTPSAVAPESLPTKILSPAFRSGIASWYSETDPFINKHTANGEIFDDTQMTCASWDYPFNTLLEVTNTANGKSVVCRVNDRGPAKRLNRIVDLSKAAFKKIENPRKGLTLVKMRVVPKKSQSAAQAFKTAKNLH